MSDYTDIRPAEQIGTDDEGEPIYRPAFGEGRLTEARWERKAVRRLLQPIDARLDEIDAASIRPTRAIDRAQAKGEEPESGDVDRLDELEVAAESLRSQRSEIVDLCKTEDADALKAYTIEWPEV